MKNKKENGVVVVEASIVVTIVVILVSVMLFVGMILYQQSLATIMANQTASAVAQVYSNNQKDPFTGYIDIDKVYQNVTYSNVKTDSYTNIIKDKADIYAKYRLKSSQILLGGDPEVKVEIVKKKNELLKSQIVVTIKDAYDLPLAGFFGADGLFEFSAQGRADCVDYLDYLNGAEAIGNPEANTAIVFDEKCTVYFIPNKNDGVIKWTTPVRTGKTIASSRAFTKSLMPTKPGDYIPKFEFIGWVQEDGVTPFTENTEVNTNIKVYGKWNCTVTYDATGGTVDPTSQKVVVDTQTTFAIPERPQYVFEGWYTQKNGEGTRYWDNSTIVKDNVTLYAHWSCAHNYIVQSITPGTCQQKEIEHVKCDWCGDEKDVEGEYGGHSLKHVRTEGEYCDEKVDIYQCDYNCGYSEKQANSTGKHEWGKCNKKHTSGHLFHCSSTGVKFPKDYPDKNCADKYHHCGTYTYYHIVCCRCKKLHEKCWCGVDGPSVKVVNYH